LLSVNRPWDRFASGHELMTKGIEKICGLLSEHTETISMMIRVSFWGILLRIAAALW
jgi:hypothetical protein